MERKRILWLVSWYPNKTDSFDGDFIQRHARAAAVENDIHVIFVTEAEIQAEEEWHQTGNLTEQIIYFKKPAGLLARVRKLLMWRKLFLKAAKAYIKEKGMPDCVHVHIPWKAGLIALILKKQFGLSFLITEHWGIYNDVLPDRFSARPWLAQQAFKKIYKQASAFVTVSQFLGNGVNRLVLKKEFSIIPNVVDTSLFYYQPEKRPVFTFLHVSNMAPLKNVKLILEAFHVLVVQKGIADVQLILVGNTDDKYVNAARQFGFLGTHVHFTGVVSYNEVALEMRKAHCFVLNSLIENSPCVISEALCCGLPVIATNVGGVPELMESRKGILIAVNDVNALVNAMQKMIETYSQYNFVNIAREASESFGYHAIARQFAETYDEAC